MTHYVLIEANSGYVWEETDAESPIEACKIIDTKIGGIADEYWEAARSDHSDWSSGGGCYYVYQAPSDWTPVTDGTLESEIQRVEALPMVAKVNYAGRSDLD